MSAAGEPPLHSDQKERVFISYAREDSQAASRLYDDLAKFSDLALLVVIAQCRVSVFSIGSYWKRVSTNMDVQRARLWTLPKIAHIMYRDRGMTIMCACLA